MFGEFGSDDLRGGAGDDILFGDTGFNLYNGGSGNDILTGLGDNNGGSANTLLTNPPDGYDDFTGGSGADTFDLLKLSPDEGRLFVRGQKFAVIRDFDPTNEGDKIKLPGSADNYKGLKFGEDGKSTAIVYKENPQVQLGLSLPGVSIGTGLSLEVPNETALVAILDGTLARSMTNENFYQYKGVS